jgi:hypothetical protein
MAIWQFDLFLVRENDADPILMENGWLLPQLTAVSALKAQDILVEAMGAPWLMLEDWLVFGCENGTRVDLGFEGDDKVDIHIRLSPSATEAELDAVCRFTGAMKGCLFDPVTRTRLHPDRGTVAAALDNSRAAAFSRAPRAFLKTLSKS